MRKNKDAGFISIEVIGALLIFAILIPTLIGLVEWGIIEMNKRSAANHLELVATAVQRYAERNYEVLLAASDATRGSTIDIPTLKSEQYLPDAFGLENVWGQGYAIHFREPREGELQGIILTTGGSNTKEDFTMVTIPSTASLVKGTAGFIPTGDLAGQPANILQGVSGAWSFNLTSSNISHNGAGHLGYLITLDASSFGQEFLYRVEIPGAPSLNSMATDLDMTDNAIYGVGELQFSARDMADSTVDSYIDMETFCDDPTDEGRTFISEDHGLYICRNQQITLLSDSRNSHSVQNMTIVNADDTVEKPICPPYTDTSPMIFVVSTIIWTNANPLPMASIQTWAVDGFYDASSDTTDSTKWQVKMRVLDSSNAWTNSPDPSYAKIAVITSCAKNTTTP